MRELTGGQYFEDEVVADTILGGVSVAYFTAPWCGPCRMLKPRLEELEKDNLGLTVVRIDASIESDLAVQFTIMSVPTLLVYSGGYQVARVEGIKPKSYLQELFGKYLEG